MDTPRPVPPVRPDNDECCNSGCSPCIFDLYEEAMERYRAELRAWEARRPPEPLNKTLSFGYSGKEHQRSAVQFTPVFHVDQST
jgi:hypothetical protein